MKKIIVFIFVIFLPVYAAFSMSAPAGVSSSPQKESVSQQSDGNTTNPIRAAAQDIYRGDFDAAEKIAKQADGNSPASAEILKIISQYNQIQQSRKQAEKQTYEKKFAELEKFSIRSPKDKSQAETNEPNLIEVFAAIVNAHEAADANQKPQVLAEPFVKATIEKAKKAAADYESKGEWIDALLYCYSWLEIIYENDKAYTDKKEQLEDKAIIKASLADSPCETCIERYEKIKPEMFIRSLDVLEYSYVEPFYYSDMAEKAFKRLRYLAEVISFWKNFDPNSFKVQFEKDQVQQFVAGLASLEKEYKTESVSGLSKDQFLRMFGHILAINSATIKLQEQIVVWHFADACMNTLDPHTMIIWPKQVEDFEKNMTNEFTGIGVEISKRDGFLKAASLLPDTPAYNSGLDAGDIIEAVNGESTKEMTITCAVSKITGPAGTKVVLTVRRPNEEETRKIEITRAKIVVPTTRGWCRDDSKGWLYFVDDKDKIGYVRVTQFSATTAADLDAILIKLEGEGMKTLILDLRYNSGGYLQSAADITDLFVEKGTIVSTQPRVGLPTWETANKKGTHPNYPLVILINSGSASASEIVSGALADKTFSRAILVGEQSYGKGSVQTISPYPGGGAQLKYTMAYYHLPSGQRVNDRYAMEKLGKKDWGIKPDVKIELTNEEIKKVLDIERDNDVVAAADHKQKLTRHNLTETLEADSQLAIAVLVAKTKLVESGLEK
jgi:carboxyl-terminal processing protease